MADSTVTITTDAADVPAVVHHHGSHLDGGSFTAGLLVGAVGFWFAQRKRRARLAEQAPHPRDDRHELEVAALARRTATLERIVTAPGARVEREIDALR